MSAMATKTKRASDQRHLLDYSKGNILKICQMKCHLYTKTFPEVLRKYGLMFKRQRDGAALNLRSELTCTTHSLRLKYKSTHKSCVTHSGKK